MAIDTAEKRLSMLDFGRPGFCLPIPDGSIDVDNRLHYLGLYSGIGAGILNPSYPDGGSLDGTGLTSATLIGIGLTSSALRGAGLSGAILRPRT